jgi:hypothetical protein
MAVRNRWSIAQAVCSEPIPRTRLRPSAEIPCFWLVICQAATNQTVSGVRVAWKIVPAVGDTRRAQPPHDQRPSASRQARVPPQCGQTKPSGQRSQSR